MSEPHEAIRLETLGGDVIVYFAPTFEVQPQSRNEVLETPRGQERPPTVRDNGLWTSELTVQGNFVHSQDVKPTFREALQDLFEQETVTAQEQVDRLRGMTEYAAPGSKALYWNDREYVAQSSAEVDVADGVYPVVTVSELRTPEEGETNHSRADFTVRMSVGVARETEPEEPEV